MRDSYDLGDAARLSATFTDDDGSPIDPDVVTFTALRPNGTELVFATGDLRLVRDDVGVFHVDLSLTQAGRWVYRFTSSSDAQAAEEGAFDVAESFADSYRPTLSEVARLIPARTRAGTAAGGRLLGTFNDDTEPTAGDVLALIAKADREVSGRIGYPEDKRVQANARDVMAIYAAMLVELTFFAESVGSNRSTYTQLQALYEEKITEVVRQAQKLAAGDTDPTQLDDPLIAQSNFPGPDEQAPVGWGTQF